MTQLVLPPAAPVLAAADPSASTSPLLGSEVLRNVSGDKEKPLVEDEKSLSDQVQEAMTKLLGVSSQFKDLNGQDHNVSTREETIAMMQHYLKRLELTDAVNSKLSVIHIAGTKGKGSTCAMVERILREAGYKTGLFTSPHLITPCERFRINGKPIAESVFLRHFYAIWNGLESTADQSDEYPPMAWFFRFLTLLALHLFVDEQVDVVILEVGIGGRLDATNVIPKPVACGITTLDLDHTRVLGDTLDQIAYAKGGIIKKDVPAFTCAQDPLAMEMLEKCAAESHTRLFPVPSIDAFGPDGKTSVLGMRGDYQRVNAGLAVALASTWLKQRRGEPLSESFDYSQLLEPAVRDGLKNAFWPARSHLMEDLDHYTRFYIDGAHTLKSLEVCAEWFSQMTAKKQSSPANKRVLIFTIHHERNVASIIASLLQIPFDRVYFCKTSASRPSQAKVHTFSESLECANLGHLLSNYTDEEIRALDTVEGKLQYQMTLSRIWHALKTHLIKEDQTHRTIAVRDSVVDCINELRAGTEESKANHSFDATEEEQWSILTTGSLYLAGETLDFLQWRE
uniref:tetrahydrofolate synthase n=1 Tax=Globisporangium ultimum (strain ATCC 200006 / CBS 805.95 / DAOM BR144) TaxID=431595 RepID=K3WXR8_GLOUD